MKKFAGFLFFVMMMSFSGLSYAAFSDVNASHQNYSAISWLETQGVVQGYADGTFKPDDLINRAEFLKMLYESNGVTDYDATPLSFADVPATEWYSKYVREAFKGKVVNGYPDGTFRPANKINFAEAVKIVMNANFPESVITIGYDPCNVDYLSTSFSSHIDTSAWYWKFVSSADSLCITDFDSNAHGTWGLDPAKEISRGDMAEILYRAKATSDNAIVDAISGEYTLDEYEESLEPDNVDGSASGGDDDDDVSVSTTICTEDPVVLENGRESYPVSSKYSHLSFLGELFTADDCGADRLNEIYGNTYKWGSIFHIDFDPTAMHSEIFYDIGFVCANAGTALYDCRDWKLDHTVDVVEILKLKPYAGEIAEDECYACG